MTVLPLWTARFLPFTDLPEHVAAIATLAHWSDPASHVREHYVLALGQSPYLLYHLVGAVFARVSGDAETAHRVLLTLVGLAFPYSMRSLLRALGRDERLALLAGIPFWSRPLVVGFLPYLASVPVLLFGLALTVHWLQAPTRRGAVLLGVVSIALFFLHLNAFALFGVVAVAFALLIPGKPAPTRRELWLRIRSLPARMLWFVPALMVAAAFATRMSLARGSAGLQASGEINYLPKAALAREFPVWAHDVWLSHMDEWTAVAFWLLVTWLGLQRTQKPASSWSVLALWTPFAVTLLLFVAMPFTVGAGTMLNVRLALFFSLFILLVIELPPAGRGSFALACAMLTTAAVSLTAVVQIRRASAELGDFDRILSVMRPNSRLLGLGFLETSKVSHFFPWIHIGAYHRARGGAIASVSFSELRHWPIRYRPETAPPTKPKAFWEFEPCLFRNTSDGTYYDYVLARGNIEPFRDLPPGPAWRSIAHESDFTLYEKTDSIWPAWSVPDLGPCESRRSLELTGAKAP